MAQQSEVAQFLGNAVYDQLGVTLDADTVFALASCCEEERGNGLEAFFREAALAFSQMAMRAKESHESARAFGAAWFAHEMVAMIVQAQRL